MRIYQQKNNTIIEGINDFNLEQTLECGQCFRFYKQNDNEYVVVAYEKLIHVKHRLAAYCGWAGWRGGR